MSFTAGELVEVLRAAGEPTRLRILALLQREELSVMELGQILDQSQPRVSRHLKLLAEAGLVERFPDGAWVFYRLSGDGERRRLTDDVLGRLKAAEPVIVRDGERLGQVRRAREAEAAAYFERNAAHWDEIRSLHVAEDEVERAILEAVGPGPFERLVDLGTGAGRMLTLLGGNAGAALGLDLSQQMLNIARRQVTDRGLALCELRHGDIFATGLRDASADLVVIHQVLHYLNDPAAAVGEAARLVSPEGRLLIIDFAPHGVEHLRQAHQHRRLGFADEEIERWCVESGVPDVSTITLPPTTAEGLTVKIWLARPAEAAQRSAA
jgi:ubiquinone/menaquinone biosynthesis C-methylase UbiE/DNA-binding transcriptional ArsR family regulator